MVTVSFRLKSWLPVIIVVVLLILQIFSPAPPIMFVLIAICGVLGLSYLWARQMAGNILLQRQRRYGWAQVGDIVEERFTMHNDSWLPVLWAELRDYSDLPGYNASRAVGFASMSSTRWTTEGVCQRRGTYTLGPVDMFLGDPFGLFEVKLQHKYSEQFVVYPPIVSLPPLIELRGLARGTARTNTRSLHLTTNASSVRQYVPGDALNRIHWRTTARRSAEDREEIFVKEYDLEPSGDLWLILDMEARVNVGQIPECTEEYAVILAAGLANQMLRENHAVGLITHAKEPVIIRPRKGQQQLWELLRVLAGVHAESQVPLSQVLEEVQTIVGRGMTAALITPSTDPSWIKGLSALLQHAVHPLGLLLDAHSFGGDGDVQAMKSALADLGVPSHVIGKGFKFQEITQRRQQRPQFKVLGTGRVVMVSPGDQEKAEWVSVGQ